MENTSRLLDEGLEQLTINVLKMGEVAEKAVTTSITGFLRAEDSNEEICELSEMLVTMTVSVENKAFELIVKYQPVASDLRIINSYMKIAYDFERFGRYAWDISVTQQKFASSEECIYSKSIVEKMAIKALEMVRASVRALRNNDAEMAKSFGATENEVDQMFAQFMNEISETKATAKHVVCSLLVVRYLERIADHATYVGEAICYIATGEKIILR